jgi:hypothetical protein
MRSRENRRPLLLCGAGLVLRTGWHPAPVVVPSPPSTAYSLVISWDEVAKYIVATPESLRITADMINRYPDRFLFGTDAVAHADQSAYTKTYDLYYTDPFGSCWIRKRARRFA